MHTTNYKTENSQKILTGQKQKDLTETNKNIQKKKIALATPKRSQEKGTDCTAFIIEMYFHYS